MARGLGTSSAMTRFLLGEPMPSEELFVRATPLTRVAWQVLRALTLVATSEGEAVINVAHEMLSGMEASHAWRTLLAGWLAAAESCRTGREPSTCSHEGLPRLRHRTRHSS